LDMQAGPRSYWRRDRQARPRCRLKSEKGAICGHNVEKGGDGKAIGGKKSSRGRSARGERGTQSREKEECKIARVGWAERLVRDTKEKNEDNWVPTDQ